MSSWRVLITRPAAECQTLEQQLAAATIYSRCLPLLAIQPTVETAQQRSLLLNLDQYHAVVVVSKPAAHFLLERIDQYWPQTPLMPTWFTVGAASGAILSQAGLSTYWPSPHNGDDSEALLALPKFKQTLQNAAQPRVLIARGTTGRNFLAETLRQQGVNVDFLPLYERYLPSYPPHTLLNLITTQKLNSIAVSSEQGLLNLLQLAADDWEQLKDLPLFVPSVRVEQTAKHAGAKHIINCRGASNEKLIAALEQFPHHFFDKD